jgi:uncharacterized protein (TIGR02996 family)
MNEQDAFLQAILDAPEDDTPRLVFADWLDDHSQSAHAELIRIQCARARKPGRDQERDLRRRERTLVGGALANSALSGHPYQRGFLTDVPLADYALLNPGMFPEVRQLLDEGRILSFELTQEQGGFSGPEAVVQLAELPWMRRLTSLYLFEGKFTAEVVPLLASPWVTNLCRITLEDTNLALPAFEALVASPSVPRITRMSFGEGFPDYPEARQAVQILTGVPWTNLKVLELHFVIGDAGARALLEASAQFAGLECLRLRNWRGPNQISGRWFDRLRQQFGDALETF